MKIIVLNGPPGCGKDTLAGIMKNMIPLSVVKTFKEPMFDIVKATLPFPFQEFMDWYNNRDMKEQKLRQLGWRSCREYMIKISEDWMKPVFGDDVFGKIAARSAREAFNSGASAIIFSDSGFQEELAKLQEEFGTENVILVKLLRDGFSFEEDSRSYLYGYGSPVIYQRLTYGYQSEDASEIISKIIEVAS